jgi:hypothetical protein
LFHRDAEGSKLPCSTLRDVAVRHRSGSDWSVVFPHVVESTSAF